MVKPLHELIHNTGAYSDSNRRSEKRLFLPGVDLKIRKSGISRLRGFVECTCVDLSANGFSFSSSSLVLFELEKVDFVLTVDGHPIKGSAVVCYSRPNSKGHQYGLMFIRSSREFGSLLVANQHSLQEVRSLAEAMAEDLAFSLDGNDSDSFPWTHCWQRLADALRCYLNRLTELGIRLPEYASDGNKWVNPNNAVVIDSDNRRVEFLRADRETVTLTKSSLAMVRIAQGDQIVYRTNDGVTLETIFDVLNYLNDEIALFETLNLR